MINLIPFCANEVTKYLLNVPYNLGGWTVACNGHVFIMVPTTAPDSKDSRPHASKMAASINWTECTHPWAEGMRIERDDTDCPACEGCGWVGRVWCEHCGGEGEVECPHCGDGMLKCSHCFQGWTTRGTPCPDCAGRGKGRFVHHVEFGEVWISGRYAHLIGKLPVLRWSIAPEMPTGNAIAFVFDGGGRGMLMGITHSYPSNI